MYKVRGSSNIWWMTTLPFVVFLTIVITNLTVSKNNRNDVVFTSQFPKINGSPVEWSVKVRLNPRDNVLFLKGTVVGHMPLERNFNTELFVESNEVPPITYHIEIKENPNAFSKDSEKYIVYFNGNLKRCSAGSYLQACELAIESYWFEVRSQINSFGWGRISEEVEVNVRGRLPTDQ